jgi:hypothetical protein
VCCFVAYTFAQNKYPRDVIQRVTTDSTSLHDVNSDTVQEETTQISDINRLTPQERLMRAKQLERKTREKDNQYLCALHPAMQSDSAGVCIFCGNVLLLQNKQTTLNRSDSTKYYPEKKRKHHQK